MGLTQKWPFDLEGQGQGSFDYWMHIAMRYDFGY